MTRWRRAPDALWRTLDGSVLVLGPDADEPVEVQGPAAGLWDLFADATTLDDAAAELAQRHGARVEVVAADLAPVIERWAADGAIVTA